MKMCHCFVIWLYMASRCAHSRFDLQTLGTFKYESRLSVTL